MSQQYDQYLIRHKAGVKQAFEFIKLYCPELIKRNDSLSKDDIEFQICFQHDHSKVKQDEYAAYDAYFYGGNRSFEVVENFRRAWLLHMHRNPHHWQHWVLVQDAPDEGELVLSMPYNYILEMICDWWSFSWEKCDLFEIFKWYKERVDYIKFHPESRVHVEVILDTIKKKLEEQIK